MVRFILQLVVIATASATVACAQTGTPAAETITLVAPGLAPYWFYHDGRLLGISIDIMRRIEPRAGIALVIKEVPLTRALEQIKSTPGTCHPYFAITPEREPNYAWLRPLMFTEWQFIVLRNSKLLINNLDDARPLRIGIMRENVQHKFLLDNGPFNLDPVTDEISNIHKLREGRIDVWAASNLAPGAYAKSQHIALKVAYTFKKNEAGIACNPDTPRATMERMQSALTALRASGEVDQIISHYVTPLDEVTTTSE